MAAYLPFDGRPNGAREIAITAGVGIVTLYVLKKLLREAAHTLFPSKLPGEENTALLASPRPRSSAAAAASDLDSVAEYDYIIVGTGTAGCVLANRLTENPKVKVLAIEAGHSDLKQLFSRIPAGLPRLFRTSADWDFSTTPQAHCNNRELQWPRGKMIGGCSSINAMMYTKGAPDDYNEIEQLGNKGWAYKDVLPYMNKSENFTESSDPNRQVTKEDLSEHGHNGPWQIGYSAQANINKIFPKGCDAVGVPLTTDINTSRGIVGAAPVQTFIDQKGQRSSTAVAYLTADVCKRPNLKIASGQTVSRIIFDTSGTRPRAIGVEMASSKITPVRYLAKAKKEVLLTSGAVGSPQLLKISGIGPAKELADLKIPLVKDLPGVGENLMDHVASHGMVLKTQKENSFHYIQDPLQSIPDIVKWLRNGSGNMRTPNSDTFAFVRTNDMPDAPPILRGNDHTSGPTSADLELIGISLCFHDQGAFVAPVKDGYASVSPVALRPESRGFVKLRSADIFDKPIIDSKSLSTDYDIQVILYGTRLATKIVHSEPYKPYFKGWYIGPHHPLDWDKATDEEILAHIRKNCETLYHPMGTAKMGIDKDAVVDEQLKVHGVDGLRVVDASIFPAPLACHPCAPVVMAAEKAADMIKGSA